MPRKSDYGRRCSVLGLACVSCSSDVCCEHRQRV